MCLTHRWLTQFTEHYIATNSRFAMYYKQKRYVDLRRIVVYKIIKCMKYNNKYKINKLKRHLNGTKERIAIHMEVDKLSPERRNFVVILQCEHIHAVVIYKWELTEKQK